MRKAYTKKKFLLAGVFTALLAAGCSSKFEQVVDSHVLVTDKWNALSKYAESKLTDYGVTVTAQFSIEFVDNKPSFILSHYKIADKEQRNDINLLTPSFRHKYICEPKCYHLLEYVNFTGIDGATLLTNYFDQYEFELFKFYGEIQVLNEQIATLAAQDSTMFKAYMHSLAAQEQSFKSAKEFTTFLTNKLTIAAYDQFIKNPVGIYDKYARTQGYAPESLWELSTNQELLSWNEGSVLAENAQWEQDKLTNTPNENWLLGEVESDIETAEGQEEVENPESSWLASNLETEEASLFNQQPALIEAVWLNDNQVQNNDGIYSFEHTLSDATRKAWSAAKQVPLVIGKNVCSFQDNYFGTLVTINAKTVNVSLLGQAKILQENVVYPMSQGGLFSSNTAIYFEPIIGEMSFSRNDVASCELR